MKIAKWAAPALALAMIPGAQAQDADKPFVFAESGEGFDTLAAAVNAVGNGRGTILIAPGTYRQCAVQNGGEIAFKALTPGTAIFDGVACEGKAALVLRGRLSRIDGLVFQNLRVPDGNGAGIRLENGNLDIVGTLFRNSEEGILTADQPQGQIRIDRSTFQRLGRCDRDLSCAHSLYIGHYGKLTVINSRFEKGNGGHYLKTRTPVVEIVGNSFDDSAGHLTNYMIDLSTGASGTISGNEMVQGRDKDNYSAFITIAPEGREASSAGLSISGNSASFVPGLDRNSTFVANWTDDAVRIGQNRLAAGIQVSDRR
jgi:hypothetical protein